MRAFLSALLILAASVAAALDLTEDQQTRLHAAEIVLLGEVHDNRLHHQGQAALMRLIAPKAVVFEMLTPEMAARAAEADLHDPAAFDAAVGWSGAGWPDATLYAPVFAAAAQTAIVGAARPATEVRRAFGDGAAVVFGTGAARFGLDKALAEDELSARIDMQFAAHCEAMPREMMGGMVEAQRFRDAAFSAVTLAALEQHGAPVVVIAGSGHVRRDWGMPGMLRTAAPHIRVLSVGFMEAPAAADDARFDMGFVTAPAPREDPCAALRK